MAFHVQVPLYRRGFLGLGFAEIGSVSARAAAGNAKPRQVGGSGWGWGWYVGWLICLRVDLCWV